MNNDFPIFSLSQPEIVKRRSERSRRLPTLPPEVLARRQEIAYILKNQIEPLANLLREMPDEERKSVFVKIKHQRPVKIIGLKPVAEPTENLTLAIIPEIDKLDNLLKKVGSSGNFMVEPLTLLSNNALKTMKALFCKGLKLSGNKPLVLGSIKEAEEP